jgi:hypothetical protein
MRRSSATWVACFAAAAFAQRLAQPSPGAEPASLAGEVRNSVSGAPIERAHVAATLDGGQHFGTYTNADGKFVLTNLSAGAYAITVDRVGFVPAANLPALAISLQPGDKNESLKLKLTPTGAIVGRVLDADGQPMEGIRVSTEVGGQIDRSVTTDDRGVYRIGGLRPGKMRIRAQTMSFPFPPEIRTDGTVEVHYSPTYHPSALDAKSAMRVEVGPATEVTGVDIRMIRTPMVRVSGKVIGIPPGAKSTYIMMQPRGSDAPVKPDGNFEMWRVDPGKYTLTAEVNQEGMFGRFSTGPIPLEVGEQDVENLQLQLLPVGDIRGQVIFEDEEARTPPAPPQNDMRHRPPPPLRRVMLRPTEQNQATPAGEIKEDSSFTLTRVAPASYRVSINSGLVYVKSMTLGPKAIDGAKLNLSGGAGDALLTVHVASAKSGINGIVRDEKGPVAGVHVAIAEESLERGVTQQTDSKDDGSYKFANLAPGKYRLFVVDDSDREELQNSLEQFDDIAEKIEVHDRETVTKDLKRK